MAAPIRLVVLTSQALRAYPLAKVETTVGSASDNDVVIDHQSVSRRHAVITRGRFGRFTVRDLDSTNGTRINGRRVAGARRIRPGDELEVGSVKFAVMNSPRRRRVLSTPAIAATLLVLTAAGFGVARYLASGARPPAAPAPSAVAPALRPEPAPAAVAKHVAPITAHEDGARPGAEGGRSATPVLAESTNGPQWLRTLNHYRSLAGTAALRAIPALSAGCLDHARYLVKNAGTAPNALVMGAEVHNEHPGNPWYSEAGLHAARSGDVEQWWGTSPTARAPLDWAINQWIGSTWHRLAILNPHLRDVGYGEYCEGGKCAAVLDVLSSTGAGGLTRAENPAPIQFPPDGATLKISALGPEWPDPLTACSGYTLPAGLPITLQLGSLVPARLSAFSLRHGSDRQILEACGFDALSYVNPVADDQSRGREALNDFGAVVVVPRQPLSPGKYTVEMTVNGRSYNWQFSIAGEDD
jgi:uncharacterized protein YkwD